MMRLFKPALYCCVPIVLAIASALVTPVAAQSTGDMLANGRGLPGAPKPGSAQGPQIAPPPALPGATSQPGLAVPSNRSATELAPNAALFDAIDRGDIASARDAIARGADLNAHNILGLTPVDLSVDLSRNDITFLLLSLRGTAGAGSSGKPAAAGAGPAMAAKAPAPVAARRPAPTLVASRTPVSEPSARRQPVISNPGTPAPQVGFLGFGGVPRQ